MLRKSVLGLSAVLAVQLAFMSPLALASEPSSADDVEYSGTEAASAIEALSAVSKDGGEDDEYNFSWLDPDKKVYVLQNRKYRKKNRLAVFVEGGFNLNNPYRTEYLGEGRLNFWFTEQLGIEAFFAGLNNSDNNNRTALRSASSAQPAVRENRSYYGFNLTWTPWYSKLNFFNKILYFDWFFSFGLGQANTAVDNNRLASGAASFTTENLFTFYFGTGHIYWLTRNFMVRLDLQGMLYNATGADGVKKHNTTNFDYSMGIGYAF